MKRCATCWQRRLPCSTYPIRYKTAAAIKYINIYRTYGCRSEINANLLFVFLCEMHSIIQTFSCSEYSYSYKQKQPEHLKMTS